MEKRVQIDYDIPIPEDAVPRGRAGFWGFEAFLYKQASRFYAGKTVKQAAGAISSFLGARKDERKEFRFVAREAEGPDEEGKIVPGVRVWRTTGELPPPEELGEGEQQIAYKERMAPAMVRSQLKELSRK